LAAPQHFAILDRMGSDILIFDGRVVRQHRERAARLAADGRFLVREVRARLVDRLDDIKRRFERVLELGCGDGELSQILAEAGHRPAVTSADPAFGFAGPAGGVVCDPELPPFAPSRFDLVIAPLTLHWVNDLPGALAQIRQILKPDGLLLAAMWGGETLRELRECLLQAEIDTVAGARPRISPFTDVRDAGGSHLDCEGSP
jgi:SAM-dependent methyltransferase